MTLIVDGTNGLTFPDVSVQATSATNATNISSGTLPFARLPAGSVLQVVQTYYRTVETISTATWTATGLSASITPKFATSKILVLVTVMVGTSYDNYGGFRLYRNGSEITAASSNQSPGTPPNAFIAVPSVANAFWSYTLANNYLDSPANTSAQTYTLYWARTYNSGSFSLNKPQSVDSGNTYTVYAPSSITLLEVAG